MTKKERDVKEAIIEITINLIAKYGDTSLITVREIANLAGVGFGLINYHFQTKDNLINICIMKLIGDTVNQLQSFSSASDTNPREKLFEISRGIMEFMVVNSGLAKISITNDFCGPNENDNTAQLTRMLLPLVNEVANREVPEEDLIILLHIYISSLEAAFLRKEVLRDTMGINLSEPQQRDNFIRFCMGKIFTE